MIAGLSAEEGWAFGAGLSSAAASRPWRWKAENPRNSGASFAWAGLILDMGLLDVAGAGVVGVP